MDIKQNKRFFIDPEFFCDGAFYLLTSQSLGNSSYTPEIISDEMLQDKSGIEKLVKEGVCLPITFPGDCALDSNTLFVFGDLNEKEEKNWIGKIQSKLNIPCGKFVFLCGGGDAYELSKAISGNPPDEDYCIFQTYDIEPGNYLVEIYAYLSSMNVQIYIEDNQKLEEYYNKNFKSIDGVDYIIRLNPLKEEPEIPKFVEDIWWCGEFDFRK